MCAAALQVTGKAKDASDQASDSAQSAKDKASKMASDSAQSAKDKASKIASDTYDAVTIAHPQWPSCCAADMLSRKSMSPTLFAALTASIFLQTGMCSQNMKHFTLTCGL